MPPGKDLGEPYEIYPIKELFLPYQWPSNGSFIYFQGDHPGDLSILSLPDRKSTALGLNPTTSGFGASDGVLSPDSRWLAYASNVTGQYQIYVTTYPPSSTRLTVSTSGGSDTRWSKNGKELFYVSLATGELMSVDVTPGNPPEFGPPRRVYAGSLDYVTIHSFDLTPDETRFLVHIPDSGSDITVLLNWPSLLKK